MPPRRQLTLEQKFRQLRKKVHDILSKYDGSRDLLSIKASDYRKNKSNESLKASFNDYQKVLYYERILKDFDHDSDDEPSPPPQDRDPVQVSSRNDNPPQDRGSSQAQTSTQSINQLNRVTSRVSRRSRSHSRGSSRTRNQVNRVSSRVSNHSRNELNNIDEDHNHGDNQNNNNNVVDVLQQAEMPPNQDISSDQTCVNCRRKQNDQVITNYGEIYRLHLHRVDSTTVIKRKKFKHISVDYNNSEIITLCHQCNQHLTEEESSISNKTEYMWPGFIWFFLTDRNIRSHYNCSILWKFIPVQWRFWWLDEFLRVSTHINITVNDPMPFFVDKTHDINHWNELIQSLTLPNLAEACNRYLLPTILCPFGCSAFIHRSGDVSIDLIFQRFLPKVQFKKYLNNKKGIEYTIPARDDYIRYDDDYDCWLLNKSWMIQPSIAFINGTPFVLTCDDHNKGTKLNIIHPPRQPFHIIASKYSDQLSHCCIRSRTIKPMKSSQFSNGYQMHEQRGSFNGIDTCNVTTFNKFDFRSKLLRDSEARYLLNRPDINALLSQMVNEERISKTFANDKRKYAEDFYGDFDYQPYYYGSTYIPIEHAMEMKKELIDSSIQVIIDNRYVSSVQHQDSSD